MVTDAMNRQTKETNGYLATPLTVTDDAIASGFRTDSATQTPDSSAERRTETAPILCPICIAALKICAGFPGRHDGTNHRDHQGGTAFRALRQMRRCPGWRRWRERTMICAGSRAY
jgi:hypothetical protein